MPSVPTESVTVLVTIVVAATVDVLDARLNVHPSLERALLALTASVRSDRSVSVGTPARAVTIVSALTVRQDANAQALTLCALKNACLENVAEPATVSATASAHAQSASVTALQLCIVPSVHVVGADVPDPDVVPAAVDAPDVRLTVDASRRKVVHAPMGSAKSDLHVIVETTAHVTTDVNAPSAKQDANVEAPTVSAPLTAMQENVVEQAHVVANAILMLYTAPSVRAVSVDVPDPDVVQVTACVLDAKPTVLRLVLTGFARWDWRVDVAASVAAHASVLPAPVAANVEVPTSCVPWTA